MLLADGRIVADSSPADLLAGGWYFATETARGSSAATAASSPPRRRSRPSTRRGVARMSWPLASFAILALALAAVSPGMSARARALARSRPSPRSPRSRRSGGSRSPPLPNVKPTTDIVLIAGLHAWRRARLRGRRGRCDRLEHRLRRRVRGRRGRCSRGGSSGWPARRSAPRPADPARADGA